MADLSDETRESSDSAPSTPQNSIATAELCAQINPPTSVLGQMRNIKALIDRDLPLRRDFFQDEYMKRAFGAGDITRLDVRTMPSGELETSYRLDAFNGFTRTIPFGRGQIETINLSLNAYGEKLIDRCEIIWSNNGEEFRYEDWEHIFGKPTTIPDRSEIWYYRAIDPRRKAHQYGLDVGKYILNTALSNIKIRIVTTAVGMIDESRFQIKPKHRSND